MSIQLISVVQLSWLDRKLEEKQMRLAILSEICMVFVRLISTIIAPTAVVFSLYKH